MKRSSIAACEVFVMTASLRAAQPAIEKSPNGLQPVLTEDWSTGKIDPAKWYLLRKKWGDDNHGVVPENVRIEKDVVAGREQNVLVCEAHGDLYDGTVIGKQGQKTRVGGVIVSKLFFASGKFEVVMKVGGTKSYSGGPADPRHPVGAVPALWTYAYRLVSAGPEYRHEFVSRVPLYNPIMESYGNGSSEYWSEIDFPEFGKAGLFEHAMYNTFCQNKFHGDVFDVTPGVDGVYHTYTTEWRTQLLELPGISDAQVVKSEGFSWINDKSVPFGSYLGNPLKRLAKNRYAACFGKVAAHWLDGKKLGESREFVPSMAAQLNLGIWLPKWAGPAPWKLTTLRVASVKVWQYSDPGDVRGVLTHDITDSFDKSGSAMQVK